VAGQALPLNCKGRAMILDKSRMLSFPLLFKGKGRDRVKIRNATFETPSLTLGPLRHYPTIAKSTYPFPLSPRERNKKLPH
jgi:hypothetical protein